MSPHGGADPAGAPILAGETLDIPASLLSAATAHLHAALPNEGCGLVAIARVDGTPIATRFYPGTNVERSPVRYTMEPREVLRALRDIEARGWSLGIILHSHPHGPATPSPTDRAEARYPGVLLGIVGFGEANPRLRLWRLDPLDEAVAVVEQACRIVPEDRGGKGGR